MLSPCGMAQRRNRVALNRAQVRFSTGPLQVSLVGERAVAPVTNPVCTLATFQDFAFGCDRFDPSTDRTSELPPC